MSRLFPVKQAIETNMLEEVLRPVHAASERVIPLTFRPFEIKTIRLSMK
ncbi:glycosyl hydrolase-related protein [Paenibacillus allorhizosphaerae]